MLGRITLELRAAVGKFTTDIKTATSAIDGLEGKMSALGDAGGLAAAGIAAVGAIAVKAASDFEQTGNLIERAFGVERAKEIEGFASTLSSELGTSLQETRQGLVSLGMQLKNSLGDATAAEKQAKAITQLSADISAAMNIPFEDTLQRIQSGLRGETEAIEKLNVFIGESALKQEAMNQGLSQSVTTMSEAQKTALRLAAIYRQTADIQGAAAAEAGTFAGQLSRLEADISNLGTEIGQILLPAALDLVKGFRSVLESIKSIDPETKKLILAAGALAAALGAASFAAVKVHAAIVFIAPVATAAAAGFKVLAAAAIQFAAGANAANIMVADWALALINLAKVVGTAAAAVAVFAASYTATSAVLEAMGYRTVPDNVSVWEELKNAFSMAAESGYGLLRVLVNLASAAASLMAFSIDPTGLFGAQDKVDQLNEYLQGLVDTAQAADMMAAAADHLTAEDRALLSATEDLSTATDGLNQIMEASDAPLADTAAAKSFLAKKEKEAKRAAEEYSKALKDQIDIITKLEDALSGLADATGVADLFSEAMSGLTAARSRTGTQGNRDAEASLVVDVFGAKLVQLLEGIGTEQFSDAIGKAREAAESLGINFDRLISSSKEVSARIAAGGLDKNDRESARKKVDDAAKAFSDGATSAGRALASVSTIVPEFGSAADAAQDSIDDLSKAAREGNISQRDLGAATDNVRAAFAVQLGAMLQATEGTAFFSDALNEAQAAAARLGVSFSAVDAAMQGLSFDEVRSAPGLSIGDEASRAAFDALEGAIDSPGARKAASEALGDGIDGALSGGISVGSLAGIAGAIVGGIAGVGPQIGAEVGQVVGGVIEAALSVITAGFAVVGDAVAQILLSDPRLQSAGKAAVDAAAPMAMLGVFAAFSGPMVALGAVLVAVYGTIAALIASLGVVIAGFAVMAAAATFAALGVATLAAAVGSAIVAIAGAIAGFIAAPIAMAALASAVLSLVQGTKSFGKAQEIVSRAMDGVVDTLEPFGEQFIVLAQLFSSVIAVFLPFIEVFANGEAIGRLMFAMMQGAAIMAGTFAIVVAEAINTIANMVAGAANVMAYLLGRLSAPLTALGFPIDDLISGFEDAADAAKELGSINTGDIKDALDELGDETYDSAKLQARRDEAERRRAEEEANKAADAVSGTTSQTEALREALRNVTSDFKVAYQRFQAADAVVPGSAGRFPNDLAGRTVDPNAKISIQNLTVVANDPAELLRKIEALKRVKELAASGTLVDPRRRTGRGE